MKIAIAGGHSRKAPGAKGYLDEYECDRAFVAKLIPALKAAGHTVVDCSNEKGDQDSELAEEVRLANASGADLFLAVHLNAGGGTGTEAYTYTETTSKLAKDVCAKMSANVAAALGISSRGAKTANFYVLRKTTMPAVLLEVCFVDSATDRAAWNRTSWDALTKAVVDAIGGNAVTTQAEAGWVQDSKGWWYRRRNVAEENLEEDRRKMVLVRCRRVRGARLLEEAERIVVLLRFLVRGAAIHMRQDRGEVVRVR